MLDESLTVSRTFSPFSVLWRSSSSRGLWDPTYSEPSFVIPLTTEPEEFLSNPESNSSVSPILPFTDATVDLGASLLQLLPIIQNLFWYHDQVISYLTDNRMRDSIIR